MKKTLLALAAAAVLAVATLAPSTADARCRGCGIAAGVIGGLAVGAIIAGSQQPAYAYPQYAPQRGYVAYDGYYGAAPVGCPGGFWARRPVRDQFGNVVGYSRPRFVCPAY